MSAQFFTGEVLDIFEEDGLRVGRLRVGGAVSRVALNLLPDVRTGDTVLVHAGVALSKVEPDERAGPREE